MANKPVEQHFNKILRGDEFFLGTAADGIPICPGLVLVEMAQVAGNLTATQAPVGSLQNIQWGAALRLAQTPHKLAISLYPDGAGYQIEIASLAGERREPHVQLRLDYLPTDRRQPARLLDVSSLAARCGESLDGEDVSRLLGDGTLGYRPDHGSLVRVQRNRREALASLRLPTLLAGGAADFVLHPLLFEGALETMALLAGTKPAHTVFRPLAIDAIHIHGALPERCLAHVIKRESPSDEMTLFDVQFTDMDGHGLIDVRGLALKALPAAGQTQTTTGPTDPIEADEGREYTFSWQPTTTPDIARDQTALLVGPAPMVAATAAALTDRGIQAVQATFGDRFTTGAPYTLNPQDPEQWTQLLTDLSQGPRPQHLVWLLNEANRKLTEIPEATALHALIHASQRVQNSRINQWHLTAMGDGATPHPATEALAGFTRSLGQILPDTRVTHLRIADGEASAVSDALAREMSLQDVAHFRRVRYSDHTRQELKAQPANLSASPSSALRRGGVYVITGGSGALGQLFGHYLTHQWDAKVVLMGRSEPQGNLAEALRQMNDAAGEAIYLQVDITEEPPLRTALAQVRDQFGAIHGVLHAAGKASHQSIIDKSPADMTQVLAPKLTGTSLLDELTAGDALDFFALFSSVAAILGDFGQCDYAVGNVYLDAFIQSRQEQVRQGLRTGRTFGVNWPLWRAGGMHGEAGGEELYLRSAGMAYLEAETGLELFTRIAASDLDQVLVLRGKGSRLDAMMGLSDKSPRRSRPQRALAQRSAPAISNASMDPTELNTRLENDLQALAAPLVDLPSHQIDRQTNLGDFGFDSINLKEFADAIATTFDVHVPPSLFFSKSTLSAIATWLQDEHSDPVHSHYASGQPQASAPAAPAHDTAAIQQSITSRLQPDLQALAAPLVDLPSHQLDNQTNLGDFGFDSINLKEFADAIATTFDVHVPPSLFFSKSTVAAIATWLQEEHHDALLKYYGQTVAPATTDTPEPETPVSTAPVSTAPPHKVEEPRLTPLAPPKPSRQDSPDTHTKQPNIASGPASQEPIAIIGAAGIFPQSENLDQFWDHLRTATDMISEVPRDRWDWRAFVRGQDELAGRAKHMGAVPGVDRFDPRFFALSPLEAELMDPQQRLFLKTAWNVIEDAGYQPATLAGKPVGVFVGVQFNDYEQMLSGLGQYKAQMATGNAQAIIPNRVSYLLNLRGSSESIDTACSGSLVALNRAVRAIRAGECEQAIAGGVSLILSPYNIMGAANLGILAPDGRCKTLDASANGYVKGEGVGAVLLKPLSQAEADGDQIYAVIKGTSVNHGGKANSLTAPNSDAQAALLVDAHQRAGFDPETISYLELHGTGTELGDPVEIDGIRAAFKTLAKQQGKTLARTGYCGIGSVKTNIGHLEPASGIAGLIKVILSMRAKTLPASLHFKQLNPYIQLEGSPFYVVDRTQPWRRLRDAAGREVPRRAGVSSFGFGGANAHVVLEEYDPQPQSAPVGPYLFTLSAKDPDALTRYAQALAAHVSSRFHLNTTPASAEEPSPIAVITDLAAAIVRVEPSDLDATEPLVDQGFDPVNLTQFIERINSAFSLDWSRDMCSDAPTLAALAERITDTVAPSKPAEPLPPLRETERRERMWRLAFTLQTGRGVFGERLAVLADSPDVLLQRLTQFQQHGSAEGIFAGNVAEHRDKAELLVAGEEGRAFVRNLVEAQKLSRLAQLWTLGIDIDWHLLYRDQKPRRISAPTYPFADERYWVEELARFNQPRTAPHGGMPALHPLLDRASSTLDLTRYTTYLDDQHSAVAGNRLGGVPAPARATFLEIARAATAHATGKPVRELRNIKMAAPLRLEQGPVDVIAELFRDGQDAAFELRTESGGNVAIYAQGNAVLHDRGTASDRLDLDSLRKPLPAPLDSAAIYGHLAAQSDEPSRVFRRLQQWRGNGQTAVADLSLTAMDEGLIFQPAAMEAALQTAALMQPANSPQVPARIDRAVVYRDLVDAKHAVAHRQDDRIHVHLTDAGGNLLASLIGLELQNLPLAVPYADQAPAPTIAATYHLDWQTALTPEPLEDDTPVLVFEGKTQLAQAMRHAVPTVAVHVGTAFKATEQTTELDPDRARHWDQLLAHLAGQNSCPGRMVLAWPLDESLGDHFGRSQMRGGAFALFQLINALARQSAVRPKQLVVLVPNDGNNAHPFHAAVSGFARSLGLVLPDLRVHIAHLDPDTDAADCALRELAATDAGITHEARYNGVQRLVKKARRLDLPPLETSRLRQGGTYLITGGAGGLGLMFARHLADRYRANLVLLGRSQADARKQAKFDTLRQLGAQVRYHAADVTDREAMAAVLDDTREHFGQLHGVLHAAGMSGTQSVTEKSWDNFTAIAAPKLHGTPILDELTRNDALDFFLVFSSTSAIIGDFGNCDYAVSNRFLDAFTRYRDQLVQAGQRHGRSVAINWPLWREGGMHGSQEAEELYLQTSGMAYLETQVGLEIFETTLAAGFHQVAVFAGKQDRLERLLGLREAPPRRRAITTTAPVQQAAGPLAADEPIEMRVERHLAQIIGDMLKLDPARLDVNDNLGNFGLDSILLKDFGNALEQFYGVEIPPIVFFHHSSIHGLRTYLLDEHAGAVQAKHASQQQSASAPVGTPATTAPSTATGASVATRSGEPVESQVEQQIARIIGDMLKIDPARLDVTDNLGNFGLDSILLKDFGSALEQFYGVEIPPIVFFHHSSIRGLRTHLLDEHGATVQAKHATLVAQPVTPVATSTPTAPTSIDWERFTPLRDRFTRRGITPIGAADGGTPEPIAVIGMSAKLPQSEDLQAFWHHLAAGDDLISEVPLSRWDWRQFWGDPNEERNKTRSKWGGFIPDADKFDARFFAISPREAEMMDPQHRVFLEAVYKAFEDAGYAPGAFSGRNVGVYAGVQFMDYQDLLNLRVGASSAQMATGNAHAMLANRVSFLLNFRGPSEAINTACSSALVAVHRAVRSLREGESEVAIAGGASLNFSPYSVVGADQLGILSSDGRCKTFDAAANGYVKGEGVGAFLLKPLSKAEADGDHIYAVIKGSAERHGGKAASLTAPNSEAQAQLLADAHREAGFAPDTISFLELHGTGTELGDPVEVEGIKAAFKLLRQAFDQPDTPAAHKHCALGAVKTNVGHLEPASGVAGMAKVILSLKNRTLPANLHQQQLNPYLKLDGTPFRVLAATETWQQPLDSQGRPVPRRAGVSSFGFGGAYGHIALEEYEAPTRSEPTIPGPHVLVLSAKTEPQLKAYAQSWLRFMDDSDALSPAAVAFTLQTGRDAMPVRLAAVAASLSDWRAALQAFVDGQTYDGLWHANTKRLKNSGSLAEETSAVERAMAAGDAAELARLWTRGAQIDWLQKYNSSTPQRLSLPTYPFARDRYWVPGTDHLDNVFQGMDALTSAAGGTTANLHPLLHQNVSTLQEQAFATRLSGQHFVFADHRVGENHVLPGVAYLEMARAAGTLALNGDVAAITDVAWMAPLTAAEDATVQLRTVLFPEHDGVRWEVVSGADDTRTLHASGGLATGDNSPQRPQPLDMNSLRQRCSGQIEGTNLYRDLREAGLDYGEGFQTLQTMYVGQNEVLAELALPAGHRLQAQGGFALHPGLLDGAFHALAGLGLGKDSGEAFIPFALDHIAMFGPLPERPTAYLRPAAEDSDKVRRFDVDLCDDAGRIAVRIQNFCLRPAGAVAVHPSTTTVAKTASSISTGALQYLAPVWENQPTPNPVDSINGPVWLLDSGDAVRKQLRNQLQDCGPCLRFEPGDQFELVDEETIRVNLADHAAVAQAVATAIEKQGAPKLVVNLLSKSAFSGEADALEGQLNQSARALLAFEWALWQDHKKHLPRQTFHLHSMTMGNEQPVDQAMAALFLSMERENPELGGCCLQVVGASRHGNAEQLALSLRRELASTSPSHWVRYRDDKRQVRALTDWQASQTHGDWLRDDAVIWITGGAGGAGAQVAEILANRAPCTLILSGRSALDERKRALLAQLEKAGATAEYHAFDLTDAEAVQHFADGVLERHGGVTCVFHAAAVLDDDYLIKKNAMRWNLVLAPKLRGTLLIDSACADHPLEQLVLFSSTAAITGNAAQTDYAFANAWLDGYAAWRKASDRPGHTLSLNWPLWQGGGMDVDDATRAELQRDLGWLPMPATAALTAIDQALATNRSQLMVTYGDRALIRAVFLGEERPHEAPQITATPQTTVAKPTSSGVDIAAVEDFFRDIVAEETKTPADQIDADEPLETYGIDSVMINNLNRQLEQHFGRLSRTLFFEHQTVGELAEHFMAKHAKALHDLLGTALGEIQAEETEAESATAPIATSDSVVAPATSQAPRSRFLSSTAHKTGLGAGKDEDIAIVGVAGRYPKAKNLAAFWQNLRAGLDCIEEIPDNRWDHWKIYDPDRTKAGKVYSKWGGFLEEFDQFDPMFFGIIPAEAELLDPQERLFLETVYHTLEDAGYTRSELWSKAVGVYVGVMYGEYQLYGAEETLKGNVFAASSSYASIANRISYWFNFHGPSMAVDTMCSSSVTTVHLACESLRRGETDMAIAGGVNLSVHPNKYVLLSQGQFAASDGRCRSFGEGGDGYVPGEGVGAVLLKPVAKAVADGDHIYGVIKATHLNHGGKTNGYTVPNPKAQGRLIQKALKQSGIDPATMGYVETHGTGTSLGDPIEVTGLMSVYGDLDLPSKSLPIGSVKSNVGHLESAAGVVGLTKILLQMQHGELVPSLHSQTLNPNIDFDETPFDVVQSVRPWPRKQIERNGQTIELPRRASLSSFGAGGSNGHIVLEEYREAPPITLPARPEVLLLSAKDADRLPLIAGALAEAIQSNRNHPRFTLTNLAYTLMAGRERLPVRLAFVAKDWDHALTTLQAIASEAEPAATLYRAEVFTRKDAAPDPGADTLQQWIQAGEWSKLAKSLATSNAKCVDLLYGESLQRPVKRLALPGYPFDRQHYWVPVTAHDAFQQGGMARLHPFLARNTSTLQEQRYTSTFRASDWFLADHQIGGQAMLPGAVIIEMARAAGALADEHTITGLRDLRWLRAVTIGTNERDLHLSLFPEWDAIGFELHADGAAGQPVIFAAGFLVTTQQAASEQQPLQVIRNRMREQVDTRELYQQLAAAGLQYGPRFQALDSLAFNGEEALAGLKRPENVDDEALVLHPSLLDAAFQAVTPLMPREGGPFVPYGLDELNIFGDLNRTRLFVHVTRTAQTQADDPRFQLNLLDEYGTCLAALQGFCLRATPVRETSEQAVLYYRPQWVDRPKAQATPAWPPLSDGPWWLVGTDKALTKALGQSASDRNQVLTINHGRNFNAKDSRVTLDLAEAGHWQQLIADRGLPSGVLVDLRNLSNDKDWPSQAINMGAWLFAIGSVLAAQKPARPVHCLVVGSDANHLPLGGFARTNAMENPFLRWKSLATGGADTAQVASWIADEWAADASNGLEIRYQQDQRQDRQLREATAPTTIAAPWRRDGVYLMTGGLGGLGQLFAKHLVDHYAARLILIGRSSLDDKRRQRLAALDPSGRSTYRACDVTDAAAVKQLITEITKQHGRLNGIVHAAGMTRDGMLATKTQADWQTVTQPKLAGTVNLDTASAHLDLDLFVLFGSTSGEFGNTGQTDYAFANAFQDRFTAWRRRQSDRTGLSLCVDWPLWAAGGMQVDDQVLAAIRRDLGMTPLATQAGLQALDVALSMGETQCLVIAGIGDRIRGVLSPSQSVASQTTASTKSDVTEALRAAAEDFVKGMVSDHTKLPKKKIRAAESFENYGIDSVMIMNFTRALEDVFGSLPKTLFFEYQTVGELAEYLAAHHGDTLKAQQGLQDSAPTAQPAATETSAQAPATGTDSGTAPTRRRRARFSSSEPAPARDIAIIGVAGRYPQAGDLDAFWQNLAGGVDSIQTIPADRWRNSRYFDPQKGQPGKYYNQWGGFLDGIDQFDPLFFNISPRDAAWIDPQERLFLETAYHTVEDAGYSRENLRGQKVGVFAGVMWGHFQLFGTQDPELITGSTYASIANRVSYWFDFQGPSVALDTMCSSSLTAIHMGMRAIQNGDADMALAGGVNLSLHPNKYLLLAQAGFMSTDGRCRAFGAGGDGYVPGEGVGAVLLKSLDKAVADGDHIYAVIKASRLNHGGKTNGYTVPNPLQQGALIREALQDSGIDPRTLGYLEAHGTGTALGDPVEINGLLRAFGDHDLPPGQIPIGSVKSNIGHLESAAGIAAVTKVLLQMKHGYLAPSLHTAELNPNIDFNASPFRVQRELAPWPQPSLIRNGREETLPRRAGISSFGAGGANAHLILEAYESPAASAHLHRAVPDDHTSEPQVVILSAHHTASLQTMVRQLLAWIEGERAGGLVSVPATAKQPPAHFFNLVRRHVSEVLSVAPDELDLDEGFTDLGFDPPSLSRLCASLSAETDLDITPDRLSNCGDPATLADWLEEQAATTAVRVPAEVPRQPTLPALADLAFTLQTGREDRSERLAWVVADYIDLAAKLRTFLADGSQAIAGSVKGDRADADLLMDGEAGAAFLKMVLQSGDLTKLAKLWVGGTAINWLQLHGKGRQRVSLPPYPFARERYWPPVPEPHSARGGNTATTARQRVVLRRKWEAQAATPPGVIAGRVLLLTTTDQTHDGLFADDCDLRTIYVGQGGFDPCEGAAGRETARALLNEGFQPDAIVDISDLAQHAKRGLPLGKITLLQTLIAEKPAQARHILHLTQGIRVIDGETPTLDYPQGAIFAGFIAAIAAEYGRCVARSIDIDTKRNLAGLIAAELQAEHRDPLLAIRQNTRYAPRPVMVDRDHHRWDNQPLDAEKVYVITGGTRGIGADLATHLITRGARKLALTGISPYPPKDQWDAILANPSENPRQATKVQTIRDLEAAGASVDLYIGPLHDRAGVAAFFKHLQTERGPIGGLIHNAGLTLSEQPALIHKPAEHIQTVCEPKIAGTLTLCEILSDYEPDFIVFTSSVSGSVPTVAGGVGDYAAANAFLDTYASFYAAKFGWPVRSLVWPNWKETGMGEVKSPAYAALGLLALPTTDGMALFDAAMDTDADWLLPALVDPSVFDPGVLPLVKAVPTASKPPAQTATATMPAAQDGDLASFALANLRRIIGEELQIPADKLDNDTPFGDYGVDSILIADLVRKIEPWLQSELDPSALLENQTLRALADFLAEDKADALNKLVPSETAADTAAPQPATPTKTQDVPPVAPEPKASTTPPPRPVQPVDPHRGQAFTPARPMMVAVIGMACHFPMGGNVDEFWQNLAEGRSGIREIPAQRWDMNRFFDPVPQAGKSYSKWGGFMNGIDQFDPAYFKLSEKVAPNMDPAIRHFLEVTVECVNHAGYQADELSGRSVGVYAGSRLSNYASRVRNSEKENIIGVGQNFIAAHASHFLNLKGPNMVIDSACSSSLSAIHTACQSMMLGETEMAIAGGVDILLDEEVYLGLSESRALSPDGKCYTFDERANGFVPGEGAGCVLLKPLDRAVADGDQIYAVINASALNNDGRTMGITTPNPNAQRDVIRMAMDKGDIDPNSVTFIETHGTGTMIGDPIELKALTKVFQAGTQDRGYCAVGSVKSNVGHLLSAAGIVSFIKVALSLHNKRIPPTLHCETPNPRFAFDRSPFYPNTQLRDWQPRQGIRRAGISSFGFGGTNAHIIVDEFQPPAGYMVKRQPLPPLPFNRKSYWLDKPTNADNAAAPDTPPDMPLMLEFVDSDS